MILVSGKTREAVLTMRGGGGEGEDVASPPAALLPTIGRQQQGARRDKAASPTVTRQPHATAHPRTTGSDVETMRYSGVVRIAKEPSQGVPESLAEVEGKRKDVVKAAEAAPQETHLGEAEQALVQEIRERMTQMHIEPAPVLLLLRTLAQNYVQEMKKKNEEGIKERESLVVDLAAAQGDIGDLREELELAEVTRSELEKKILDTETEVARLRQTITHLEADLQEKDSAAGISSEEFGRMKVQLAKARAAGEVQKKQADAMQEKMLEAERSRRAEEAAFREKRHQIERELRSTLENYGPDKVRELGGQLEEALSELDVLKEQLRKGKQGLRQQHKLVVEWRIRVKDIEVKMSEQDGVTKEKDDDIQGKANYISDLRNQVSQLESDLKKVRMQLSSSNTKLNDYVDKFTRQSAYVKQQEGMWKAMQAKHRLMLNQQEESGEGGPPENTDLSSRGSSRRLSMSGGTGRRSSTAGGGGRSPHRSPPRTTAIPGEIQEKAGGRPQSKMPSGDDPIKFVNDGQEQ